MYTSLTENIYIFDLNPKVFLKWRVWVLTFRIMYKKEYGILKTKFI